MSRKPVGIAKAKTTAVVVCDDGSAWVMWGEAARGKDWWEVDPIPGSQRAEELEAPKPQTVAPQRWEV